MTNTINTILCLLFTPGNRPERFEKVKSTEANGIIIDLEDAVSPDDKDKARALAIEYLKTVSKKHNFFHCLRINSTDTADGLRDVLALISEDVIPDILILPKVESAGTLLQLDSLLGAKAPPYMAMLESARGYNCIDEIAGCSDNLVALIFGGGDLSADIDAQFSWEPLLFFRSRLIQAAKKEGLMAFDVPYVHLTDTDDKGIKEETERVKALGYNGKLAIHPKHITSIRDVYRPTSKEVAHAQAILDAFEQASGGVCVVNGKMIDAPLVANARRVVDLKKLLN